MPTCPTRLPPLSEPIQTVPQGSFLSITVCPLPEVFVYLVPWIKGPNMWYVDKDLDKPSLLLFLL